MHCTAERKVFDHRGVNRLVKQKSEKNFCAIPWTKKGERKHGEKTVSFSF